MDDRGNFPEPETDETGTNDSLIEENNTKTSLQPSDHSYPLDQPLLTVRMDVEWTMRSTPAGIVNGYTGPLKNVLKNLLKNKHLGSLFTVTGSIDQLITTVILSLPWYTGKERLFDHISLSVDYGKVLTSMSNLCYRFGDLTRFVGDML